MSDSQAQADPSRVRARRAALILLVVAALMLAVSVLKGYLDYNSPFASTMRETKRTAMQQMFPSVPYEELDIEGSLPTDTMFGSIFFQETTLGAAICVVAAWGVMVARKPSTVSDSGVDIVDEPEPNEAPESDAGPFF